MNKVEQYVFASGWLLFAVSATMYWLRDFKHLLNHGWDWVSLEEKHPIRWKTRWKWLTPTATPGERKIWFFFIYPLALCLTLSGSLHVWLKIFGIGS